MKKWEKKLAEGYGQFKEWIADRKWRLAAAAAVTLLLFLISSYFLYEGINKRFLLYTLLSLLTGMAVLLPKPKKLIFVLPVMILYFAWVPLKAFQRLELPVQDLNGLLPGAVMGNILGILLLYAILLLLTQKLEYALPAGNLILCVAMLLNYYCNQLRGRGLCFYDLLSLRGLLTEILQSGTGISGEVWYSILYFAAFAAIGSWCCIPATLPKYHGVISIAAVSYGLVFVLFWQGSGYLEKNGLQGYHGSSQYDEELDGFLLGFGLGIRELREEKLWYEKFPVICHALGSTEEGDPEGNYLEGLLYNYELGHRIFETDIQITSDQVAVLRHDWGQDLGQAEYFGWTEEEEHQIPTAEAFLEAPIYGKYTPMTLLQLYEIMAEKTDIYMVLDPKYTPEVREQWELIVRTAVDNGYESVLNRVIVQIYYEEMYDEVAAVYPFQNYLFTLYNIGWPGGAEVGEFCKEKGIPVLTMPYTWIDSSIVGELEDYPWLKVYVHTVNDPQEASDLLAYPIDGIYSGRIHPSQMIRWMHAQ